MGTGQEERVLGHGGGELRAEEERHGREGAEVGKQGTGCCVNSGPVLEKTAARLRGRERKG